MAPGLSYDAAKYLTEKRIVAIGLDTPFIDAVPEGMLQGKAATAPGTEQGFTFTPNTADGVTAAGTLVIDPLDFGADEYGAVLTSDFEFQISGTVTFTYPGGATRELVTGTPIRRPSLPPSSAEPPAPSSKAKAKANA